ncbi:MAG: helix-turn-helix domain-containing protein [Sporichthyaceae bacterium]
MRHHRSAASQPTDDGGEVRPDWRAMGRDQATRNALRKRAAGVPTYSVSEAAALLSVSQEHLYRLIRADVFPAVRMRSGDEMGRYVVPAQAVESVLERAVSGGACAEIADLVEHWRAQGATDENKGEQQ